jgi:hypothetical protein
VEPSTPPPTRVLGFFKLRVKRTPRAGSYVLNTGFPVELPCLNNRNNNAIPSTVVYSDWNRVLSTRVLGKQNGNAVDAVVIEGDCSMVATATQLDTVNLEIRDKEGECPPSDIGNSETLSQCPSNNQKPQIFPTQQAPKTSNSSRFPGVKRRPLSFFEIKILLHENDNDIDV